MGSIVGYERVFSSSRYGLVCSGTFRDWRQIAQLPMRVVITPIGKVLGAMLTLERPLAGVNPLVSLEKIGHVL